MPLRSILEPGGGWGHEPARHVATVGSSAIRHPWEALAVAGGVLVSLTVGRIVDRVRRMRYTSK